MIRQGNFVPGLLPVAMWLAAVADAAADGPGRPCINVQVGDARAPDLACLNAELALSVEDQLRRNAALQVMVEGVAPSSPTSQGLYNQAATRERLGDSFGHSVIPQRPSPVYINPFDPPKR
jgi:hypothetical protein